MQLDGRTLNGQMQVIGTPYNEVTTQEQNIGLRLQAPTCIIPQTKAPTYLPNEPSLATLPPPRTRLTSEIMRDYTREPLIEELNRLNIPYSHTTQSYDMQKLIVYHYTRLHAQSKSSQASPRKARTARYINEQSGGLNVETLTKV